MKIPYLNVETCENVLVICNACFFCYFPPVITLRFCLPFGLKSGPNGRFAAVGVSLLTASYQTTRVKVSRGVA